MTWCNYFYKVDFSIRNTYRLFPYILYLLFLDSIEKMLKHWDCKNKFRIFFHKTLTSQKLIPQNTSFFMPQSQKYMEWNNHFCTAHTGDFFISNRVYLSAQEL